MFDIGASEFLLIVVVAIVVIGPKDLPAALRAAGRWIARARRVSGHFRTGIESMIREAELEEMERKWREQNEAIMKAHPQPGDGASAAAIEGNAVAAGELPPPQPDALSQPVPEPEPESHQRTAEPQLPLPPP